MAVTPSVTAIAQLRRLTAATVDPKLTDEDLADALRMYAVADGDGVAPDSEVGSAWVETYDMAGAAMEAWTWKKGMASHLVNFNADGSQASMSDISEHIQERINYFANQRMTGTITVAAE